MKILLNATTLLTKKAGIGYYVEKLSKRLLEKKIDVTFFFKDFFSSSINKQEIKKHFIRKLSNKSPILDHLLDSYFFNKNIKLNRYDLYHEPNFLCFPSKIKTLVTIHDLSWILYPEFFEKKIVNKMNFFIYKSINRAEKIIANSKFTKNQIKNYFNIDEKKIVKIYEDYNILFYKRTRVECELVLKKFKLNYKKYIISVGTIEPRKNHLGLIDSYTQIKKELQNEYPLVIVGNVGWLSENILKKIKENKNIILLTNIPTRELAVIVSGAIIMTYPSFYEGFGIPIIEAMASGTPVIASATSSMKEIVSDSGILVDPKNINGWSEEIENLVNNKKKREILSMLGIKRSGMFYPGKNAEETIKLYKSIC